MASEGLLSSQSMSPSIMLAKAHGSDADLRLGPSRPRGNLGHVALGELSAVISGVVMRGARS